MSQMTYADAGKAALAESMRADPTIWAVGEDLGRGGVFGQYMGMEEEFGPERIVSAPISEAAIMGLIQDPDAMVEYLGLEFEYTEPAE